MIYLFLHCRIYSGYKFRNHIGFTLNSLDNKLTLKLDRTSDMSLISIFNTSLYMSRPLFHSTYHSHSAGCISLIRHIQVLFSHKLNVDLANPIGVLCSD